MKECANCRQVKSYNEYYKRHLSKDGYQSTCRECKSEKAKKVYAQDKEDKLRSNKEWRNNNPNYYKEYVKAKRRSDVSYRFIFNLRNRQSWVLKGKTSTTKGLGCNKDYFKSYIQSLFKEGMTWDNYGHGRGKWELDHILPLSSHERDSTGGWDITSEYNKKLIHYTNIQPLWHIENLAKANKLPNV